METLSLSNSVAELFDVAPKDLDSFSWKSQFCYKW
jgi:hypothetical protein